VEAAHSVPVHRWSGVGWLAGMVGAVPSSQGGHVSATTFRRQRGVGLGDRGGLAGDDRWGSGAGGDCRGSGGTVSGVRVTGVGTSEPPPEARAALQVGRRSG
jgi:hypothetical protein